jgi:hypothetical protein
MKIDTQSRAIAAYMGHPPDFVVALARACDQTSQAHMARELRYSRTVISLLVNNRYVDRDLTRVERKIRAYLMQVECPVLGRIEGEVCRSHQEAPFRSTNPTTVQLYRACHGDCPHSFVAKKAKATP